MSLNQISDWFEKWSLRLSVIVVYCSYSLLFEGLLFYNLIHGWILDALKCQLMLLVAVLLLYGQLLVFGSVNKYLMPKRNK